MKKEVKMLQNLVEFVLGESKKMPKYGKILLFKNLKKYLFEVYNLKNLASKH